MRILGIDPGSIFCGYGVIDNDKNSFKLVELGVIKAKERFPEFYPRLGEIYNRIEALIKRTNCTAAAFESIFFAKNPQSMMKLTHARAVAILAAVREGLPIFEYSPREIKKAVTGRGNAGKEQVGFMVQKILAIEETPELYDVSDALAVAVCHALKGKSLSSKSSSWTDYIKNNPNKIVKV
ncbi:MAG: crossover junction endodeoxyribonuclease RuvC [Bacteroidota bacterium]|nr:crossover junction endodeoxyribonuclease RuvC [Bacteroidota bacterium]